MLWQLLLRLEVNAMNLSKHWWGKLLGSYTDRARSRPSRRSDPPRRMLINEHICIGVGPGNSSLLTTPTNQVNLSGSHVTPVSLANLLVVSHWSVRHRIQPMTSW